jgi:hypothetical protein
VARGLNGAGRWLAESAQAALIAASAGLGHRGPAEPFQLVELAASLRTGTRRVSEQLLQPPLSSEPSLPIVADWAVDADGRGGIGASPSTSAALSRVDPNAVAVHSHGRSPRIHEWGQNDEQSGGARVHRDRGEGLQRHRSTGRARPASCFE